MYHAPVTVRSAAEPKKSTPLSRKIQLMIRACVDWAQHVHAQAFLAATSVTQLGTGLPGPVPAPEPARDIDPAHLSPPTGPASMWAQNYRVLLACCPIGRIFIRVSTVHIDPA